MKQQKREQTVFIIIQEKGRPWTKLIISYKYSTNSSKR